jgi:hypothetical protein
MKLRKKVRTPHRSGKSTPKSHSTKVMPKAVTRLTMARRPNESATLWPITVNLAT